MENCNCNDFDNPSIMQGDQYGIPFNITDGEDIAITPETASDIEIAIGQIVKRYSTGEIEFNNDYWIFPLTQSETFMLQYPQDVQVRVKFLNGEIIGERFGKIDITESKSKEVL